MSRATLLIAGAIALAAARGGGAQEVKPYTSTPQERLKAFAWFDGLGYPDVRGLAVIRFDDRGCCFVLREQGDTLTVLTSGLATETIPATRPGAEEGERVPPKRVVLAALAAAAIAGPTDDPSEERWHGSPRPVSERVELFVLAWACARNGLERQAAALFDRAASVPREQTQTPDAPGRSFRQALAEEMAYAETWRALVAFGDARLSRADLLARFERVVRLFPDSPDRGRAEDMAGVLRRMLEEDGEHPKRRAGKPFDRLTKTEQIADLIFRLRAQTTREDSPPGWNHHFAPEDPADTSPAARLARAGYDAVPQLLDALRDERPTRSVHIPGGFAAEPVVAPVSLWASWILPHVTGRWSLHEPADVKVWYDGLLAKGERQVLVEDTARGDGDSAGQGARLLRKYPDAALAAVLAGAHAARDEQARRDLVRLAAELPGDSPVTFLLREAKGGPFVGGRVAAAAALHRRGRPEGVAMLIAEWRGRGLTPRPQDAEQPTYVIHFFAYCGNIKAVEALGEDFPRRPLSQRLDIVSALWAITITGDPEMGPPKPRDDPKRLKAAFERMLVAALDDLDERSFVLAVPIAEWHPQGPPRVCDLAAEALHAHDPKKYPFDGAAALARRDRAIVGLKNAWRIANGLPPLPVAPPPRVDPAAEETLRPLLDRLLTGPESGRAAARLQVEALGPPALPGVRARSAGAGAPEKWQRGGLEALSRRLACTVVAVRFAPRSLQPGAALSARLDALKGKPLEARAFVDLLTFMARERPAGLHGFRLGCDRDTDGAGLTLRLDLLDRERAALHDGAPKGESPSWHFHEWVLGVGRSLHWACGAVTHADLVREGRGELLRRLAAALEQTGHDDAIDARVQMILRGE